MKKNNNQIDNTSYYLLPCGKMLEDFIYVNSRYIGFHLGNAIKYFWRAGKKYGESMEKDMAKCHHYAKFLAEKSGVETSDVLMLVDKWCRTAEKWDGESEGLFVKERNQQMKNSEKYKTPGERAIAFNAYCDHSSCQKCFDDGIGHAVPCLLKWLDLEAEEEKPLPCPGCGNTDMHVHDEIQDSKVYIVCPNCGYRSPGR